MENWYLFTSSTYKRKIVFASSEIRLICYNSFINTAKKFNYKVSCFVIIPNHVHILVSSKHNDQPKIIRHFKGVSARNVFVNFPDVKFDMRTRHLWTKGYHCSFIDNIVKYNKAVKYIKDNPKKGNLNKDCYSVYIK